MKLRAADGYTFVELMIVLALIGLMTLVLVVGSGSTIKTQRFSDAVRDFTNNIKAVQTASYTINSGTTLHPCGGNTFWRGNLLEFDANATTYTQYVLSGCDLSAFANHDQTVGITSKDDPKTFDLTQAGLEIQSITYGGAPCASCKVSLAFLAPDGLMFTQEPFATDYGSSSVPFAQKQPIVIRLTDLNGTNLIGIVTIDPVSGNISSIVQ